MSNFRLKINRIFGYGAELTGLDLKYFARGGFWSTFGQASNFAVAFLLTVAFANLLPKETYGLYRYVISLIGIFNIFTLSGMNDAVSRAAAAGNEGILKTSVKYQLKWNLAMLLAFWLLGAYYFLNSNFPIAAALFVLGIFSPITAALNTYGAFLDGKKEFKRNNIFSAVSTLVYAIGMVAAMVFGQKLVWLVFAYSLTTFATNLLFYLITVRQFPSRDDISEEKEVLKYGRRLTFIGLIGPVVSQIDSVILNHFWGPAQLAVYSLAMAIPDKAVPVVKSWVSVGFPKLVLKTPEEINRVFYKRVLQGLAVGFIIAITYILAAPYIFKLLMPKYLDAILYSQLLAVTFVFAMPNRYVSAIMTAQKMTGAIFINNIVQNLIRISLYAVLGIFGGIMGLIIAQVINSFLSMVINIFVYRFKTSNS